MQARCCLFPAVDYRACPMETRRECDPLGWCALIAAGFLTLVWHRLFIPSKIYFDEVHYTAAARKLLELAPANLEHPMLGKEIIAASIRLLGDDPHGWRVPVALFGTLGLFAFGRLIWLASGRRFATLAGMVLLATNFMWFVMSRIAMLDMFMAGFGMVALWQFAAALHQPTVRKARVRLALSGFCLGLAMGAKWSIVPVAVMPGLTFLALRLRDHRWRFLTANTTGPVPGVSLLEAALWLGLLPLAVYWATYMPGFLFRSDPISPWAVMAHHQRMIALQDSVVQHHTYATRWYEWVSNWRGIWFLYEKVDGALRGILLIGNPFSMLAGLCAWLWCLWAAWKFRRGDALAFALLYLVSIALWIVSSKPVQFYYHYLLPGTFLMGCLALALDAMWRKGGDWRPPPLLLTGIAVVLFVWFYPILSAAELHDGPRSFEHWMWLDSWR